MNQLNKELAVKAGFAADDYEMFESIFEKYGQLLIQECLAFVEPTPGSGDIDDLALESATAQIKEHFGIE